MKAFADYEQYDALGLAALVKAGKVSPAELLESAIERVEARNGAVNAVTMKLYDYGRKAIADGLPDGPFTGVPYLLKDLGAYLAGVKMTRGSKFFADTPPSTFDTEHVKRLKKAGLVIFGRTNTCELGLSLTCEPQLHGATKSPWDVTRISGGSSGGAAASVGARMLPMAHASDGFGSIRAPAACCGVVGLKPTRGRNTFAPATGEGLGGCSTEHAVTLTVRDTAALLDATAGAGPGDPYTAPPPPRPFLTEIQAERKQLRIAYTTTAPNGAPIGTEYLKALAETVVFCKDLGHKVVEADPEIDRADVVPTFLTLAAVNTMVNLGTHPTAGRPARKGEVENVTWGTAQRSEKITSADYVRATQTMHRLGRQMAAFHANYDVLLTPGLGTLPPKLGWIDMMLEDVDEYWRRVFTFSPFTVWFNL
ncbi:MAG TPA: amidase, partial [Methylomirabilota bacterium]